MWPLRRPIPPRRSLRSWREQERRVAVSKSDVAHYPCGAATAVAAVTTAAAMQSLEQLRPAIVVIDWDLAALDAATVCRAATQRASTIVLITTQVPDRVPAALKCGCHAVLLKPFTVNLAAARLGRLCRDASVRCRPAGGCALLPDPTRVNDWSPAPAMKRRSPC
jgi:DNA-binding response OmpR family regulator